MLFHGLCIKFERNYQESEFAVRKKVNFINEKEWFNENRLLVYLTLIFFPSSFFPHFKPFSSKSFYTTIQGIVLILSMHMLWKAITFFCQFNSAQSEKDMDFKMAITITNSPFKFENSQASGLFFVYLPEIYI